MPDQFLELDDEEIVKTLDALSGRIERRFPGAGLLNVSRQFHEVAVHAQERSKQIAKPLWSLRALVVGLVLLLLVVLPAITILITRTPEEPLSLIEFIQVLEAGINDVVLLGAAAFFLWTLESRIRRKRALAALHELRSIAHIVDMHQLTKDPERLFDKTRTHEDGEPINDGPVYTPGDLAHYLDYCSEMLSLVGKVASLYVQRYDDSVALATVNEIETLCTGLSRKIWQKIMIIHQFTETE